MPIRWRMETEEKEAALYAHLRHTLVNWTDEGIRNVRGTLERTERVEQLVEKHGARLVQTQSATAFLLELGSIGTVRTHHASGIRPRGDVGDS